MPAPAAMPKKLTCTVDEVEEIRVQLVSQIEASKASVEGGIASQLAELEKRLRAEVLKVQQGVDHLDKVKVEEESCAKVARRAEEELSRVAQELRVEIEALRPVITDSVKRSRAELEEQLTQMDVATRDAFAQELESLCGHFDEELGSLRSTMEALVKQCRAEASTTITQERQQLLQALEQAKAVAAEATADARQAAAESLEKVVEAQEQVDKKRDLKAKAIQADNEAKMAELEAQIKESADAAAKALANAVVVASTDLAGASEVADRRFQEVAAQLDKVREIFNDVENVPTRRVDWVIKEAQSRVKFTEVPEEEGAEPPPPWTSFLSPRFDAAGARGLRLELRLFKPTEPPAPDQEKGDCAVFLHAPKGTHVAFRLCLGSLSENFEHKFADGEPVGTQRLCFFLEQVNAVTGSLRLGVEILECIYEFDKKIRGEEGQQQLLEASFRLQRHVNNRVLDQVKLQMDYFKKRMTRRVEWRLEQASMMRRNFPKGAPIRSKEFDAAGIDGMQILFYPSGYDSAGEGFASAYLCAPAGATLSCWLQVGSERRDINHTFDKTGQIGRANFCRWENCLDPDEDCVLIVMDIQEAHVDLVARASHAPPPAVGLRSLAREAVPLTPVGSTIKLQRMADHLPPILQEVKVLPSLWAGKNMHDVAVKVDGLRPIREVRSRGGQRSSGVRKSPSSPQLPPA